MDTQLPFPFIGAIRPDRFWWTNINTNSLRQNRIRRPQPTRAPANFVLISCSKSKLNERATARELYTGTLFKKAIVWAERHGYEWFVISALHSPTLDQSEKIYPLSRLVRIYLLISAFGRITQSSPYCMAAQSSGE